VVAAIMLGAIISAAGAQTSNQAVHPRARLILRYSQLWSGLKDRRIFYDDTEPLCAYQWRTESEIIAVVFWRGAERRPAFTFDTRSGNCEELAGFTKACGGYVDTDFLLSPDGQWLISDAFKAEPFPFNWRDANSPRWIGGRLDGTKSMLIRNEAFDRNDCGPGAFFKDDAHFIRLSGTVDKPSFTIVSLDEQQLSVTRPLLTSTFGDKKTRAFPPPVLGFTQSGLAVAMWRSEQPGGPALVILHFDPNALEPVARRFEVLLPRGARLDECALSPTGDRLAWVFAFNTDKFPIRGRSEIWLSDNRGKGLRRLVSTSVNTVAVESHFRKLRWKPDAKTITFVQNDDLLALDVPER
jgi:hypothetical protein